MIFARFVLTLAALAFLALGGVFLVVPLDYVDLIGLDPEELGSLARTEIRTLYGGGELALGVWLLASALRRTAVRSGLSFMIVIFAGLAGGRAYGISQEGGSEQVYLYLSTEVTGLVLAVAARLLLGRGPARSHPQGADLT